MVMQVFSSIYISYGIILKKILGGLVFGISLSFCSCRETRSNSKLLNEELYDFNFFDARCNSKWSSYNTDEELKNAVQRYFIDSCKIKIDEIEIFVNIYSCNSCGCPGGLRDIHVTTLGKYSQKLYKEDFKLLAMSDNNKLLDFVYHEWKCSAKWSSDCTDEELKIAVQKYFADSSLIKINDIVVWRGGLSAPSDSCGTYTGRSINITALGKYTNELNLAGFYIEIPDE